jgi:hypothetical protein
MHATFLYSFLFVVMNVPSESRVRHCMFANIPAAMPSVLMSIVDICEHHVLRCLFAHDEVLSNTAQRMRRRRRLLTRQLRTSVGILRPPAMFAFFFLESEKKKRFKN